MKLFSYESKLNQFLIHVADLIVLNLLYLICCLPVFTIGAAQAGLFTAVKVLMDKEDDRSCTKAFFRGFASGFGKITLVHCIFSLLMALLVLLLLNVLVWQYAGLAAPVWMVVTALAVAALLHTMTAPFHASFSCTAFQLFRNAFLTTLANFPRALLFTAVLYLPVALMLFMPGMFMASSIVFLLGYYSLTYCLGCYLLKKPFQLLTDNFLNAQKEAAEEAAAEASDPTEAPAGTEEV